MAPRQILRTKEEHTFLIAVLLFKFYDANYCNPIITTDPLLLIMVMHIYMTTPDITAEDKESKKYAGLAAIPNWRKKLSNFYQRSPASKPLFTLDDKEWSSVEHYFQGTKFQAINKDYYEKFALDSKSSLSRSSGDEAKKAGGKKGLPLSDSQRAQWEKEKYAVMEKAHIAKYGQNEDLRKLLLLTKDAVLTHKPGRFSALVTEHGLMKVRAQLASEKDEGKEEEKEAKEEGKEGKEKEKEEKVQGKEAKEEDREAKEKEGKGKEKEKEKEEKGKNTTQTTVKEKDTKKEQKKEKEGEEEELKASPEKEKVTKKRKDEDSAKIDKKAKTK